MRKILFWGTSILIGIYIAGGMPAWGQAPKPLTPEQQIEQLTQGVLDFKFKLGAEMQISARLKAQNIQLQKQLNETGRLLEEKLNALVEANAKVAQLEITLKDGDWKSSDNQTIQVKPEEKVETKE